MAVAMVVAEVVSVVAMLKATTMPDRAPLVTVTVTEAVATPAQGLAYFARHVIGCHVTQATRVQQTFDDVERNIWQARLDTP